MSRENRSWLLVFLGIPLGLLCGLLGLSGTEYRAPILRRLFRYSASRVAPFNLAISLMTLGGAIVGREASTSASLLWPHLQELGALVAGTLVGVYVASRFAGPRSVEPVERATLTALVVIGTALICMATLPLTFTGLGGGAWIRVPVGVLLGAVIGAVSSIRSISGGELLIPALVLAFGVDAKIAGSASACISFPIVLAGLVRHSREDRLERQREYSELAVPMGAGSTLGAITGGYLLSRVSSTHVTLLLGAALILSAIRSFQDKATD